MVAIAQPLVVVLPSHSAICCVYRGITKYIKHIMFNIAHQYQDLHPVQIVDEIVHPYKRTITS